MRLRSGPPESDPDRQVKSKIGKIGWYRQAIRRESGQRGTELKAGGVEYLNLRGFDCPISSTHGLVVGKSWVNNRLIDFQHMIELFSQRQPDYFKAAPLGIHSLPGHFRKMEKDLERLVPSRDTHKEVTETNVIEAEQVLATDNLFQELVVQRSRGYVKESQRQGNGRVAIFPEREAPRVVEYSVKKTYGRLLTMIEKAFAKEKPLFSLAIYFPLAYYRGPDITIDPLVEGRQKQVVALIRTQFLKRFESSARAFELSCVMLLKKLLAFVTKHSQTPAEKARFERWKAQNIDGLGFVRNSQLDLFERQLDLGEAQQESFDDLIDEEMIDNVIELSREEYKVEEILSETFLDLDQAMEFLSELKKFKPSHDDKLTALTKLLKSDLVLKKHKVLIFTEYMATARYLKEQLEEAGIIGIDEVDSEVKRDRGEIIRQFAPYYNGSSSGLLAAEGLEETRVLISTDVLSEGLNLQDATRLINYDLHWNPVRLMQRIGRVDRRMNSETEAGIVADHPDQKNIRGTVAYWNFLPPEELDELLRLYSRVSHKTLRISKTFGIEGKKLLRPDDDYEALKDFNHAYEGTTTSLEAMHLEYQKLLQDNPSMTDRLADLPGRVFSGKKHPNEGAKAVFFCYNLPAAPAQDKPFNDVAQWTEEAGRTAWYLYDLANENIVEDPGEIIDVIRSMPETPRQQLILKDLFSTIKAKVEKHIRNTYLKKVQSPIGVGANLVCWMEVC